MKLTLGSLIVLGTTGLNAAYEFPIEKVAKLAFLDDIRDDHFGYSVAISGDTAVVGAYADSLNNVPYSGSIFVFERNKGGTNNWGFVKKLSASDSAQNDSFGIDLDIDGNTIVVGASGDDNSIGTDTGAVYIFERDHGGANNWGQVKKIVAHDGRNNDWFGDAVAIDGDTVVVGAPGVNVGGPETGRAYIFYRDFGGLHNWGQVKTLTASDHSNRAFFARDVAISGDTVAIASLRRDTSGVVSGAAYIFERNKGGSNQWGQAKKVRGDDVDDDDHFGFSVAVGPDILVVGSVYDNQLGIEAGSAYIFERNEGGTGNWGQAKKILPSHESRSGFDNFGRDVAVDGEIVIVGSIYSVYEDESKISWGSHPSVGNYRGVTYIFHRDAFGSQNWGEIKILYSEDDAQARDLLFGVAVGIDSNTVIVGCSEDTGHYMEDDGAAYIFTSDFVFSQSPILETNESLLIGVSEEVTEMVRYLGQVAFTG